MRIQDHVVDVAREAGAEFFRYAHAVPGDRREWIPAAGTQSILQLCQEVAITPTWAYQVTMGIQLAEAELAEQRPTMESWNTIEICEKEFENRWTQWADMVRTLSDDDLSKTRWLPYNGGRDHTYLEMLEYPRWNITYHLGQVAMIQLMYGDKEMY